MYFTLSYLSCTAENFLFKLAQKFRLWIIHNTVVAKPYAEGLNTTKHIISHGELLESCTYQGTLPDVPIHMLCQEAE